MYSSTVTFTSLTILFLTRNSLAILFDLYNWIISLSITIETFYITAISFVLNLYNLV